jgi:hypothetical protein
MAKITAMVLWTLFCLYVGIKSVWRVLSMPAHESSEAYRAGKLTGSVVGIVLTWWLIPAAIRLVLRLWNRPPKAGRGAEARGPNPPN